MSPSGDSTNGSRISSCINGDNDLNPHDDFGKSDEFTCIDSKISDRIDLSSSSSYCSSESKSVNDSEKLRRIIVASIKGFTIGTGLKGGLAIFSIVARFARRRRSSSQSRKTGEFSNSEAIVLGIKETLRYGLFLGTFAGTFVSVDEAIAALVGDKRFDHCVK